MKAAGPLMHDMEPALHNDIQRLRVTVRGAVQGVGFRPFVYRLAEELALRGWVRNSGQGVFIEAEGTPENLKLFVLRLNDEKPPRAFIQSLESSYLDAVGFRKFEILPSDGRGEKTALVLPDIAVCSECLADIADPTNRRYLYPFTNCTNCGPRFSIIEALPYDRLNTSMKRFEMCDDCRTEYDDPHDRRFHAQPNACPECGPHLELWDPDGRVIASRHEALLAAADAIRAGQIAAVKGLGGFHLMADAADHPAVAELRRRKHREEKPLALMFPSLEAIEEACIVSDIEQRLLASPESPIVLLKRRGETQGLSDGIAPGNPYLGVMLPYTPLHRLLLDELGFPVVATSGNLSDEPICIDEFEALERLREITDVFLVHDRPIVRHVDDSIVRVMMGREMVVRRARGFAPLPVTLRTELPPAVAVGAHLKNTVAVTSGRNVFVSQHIGDLETVPAFEAFRQVIDSLETLFEVRPQIAAADLHPDYVSTSWATTSTLSQVRVQHHYAHILSCMAENDVRPPILGVAWDGTGYGLDGTIWGGEFLTMNEHGFERFAHLRTFRLPGGDLAAKEPRRSALAVLFELFGDAGFKMMDIPTVEAFTVQELSLIRPLLQKGLNAPVTSSAGRLFDAVSSLLGLRQKLGFEGQAAMELEFIADEDENTSYEFFIPEPNGAAAVIDWRPMVLDIIGDHAMGIGNSTIAAKFHNTLVEMIVRVARLAGERSVALSGGCFQNRYLLERAVRRLREESFKVYWHQRVPPNDGGIALGQAVAAAIEAPGTNRGTSSPERRTESKCV